MATPNPEKLQAGKQHGLKFVAMAIVRQPATHRLFLGGSDFKLYTADPTVAKFEPKEIGKHESYVTGLTLADKALVSGGYDGKLSWWDFDRATNIRTVDAHAKVIRVHAGGARHIAPDRCLQRVGRSYVVVQRQAVLHAVGQETRVFAAAVVVPLVENGVWRGAGFERREDAGYLAAAT